jgi:hypothetical protein
MAPVKCDLAKLLLIAAGFLKLLASCRAAGLWVEPPAKCTTSAQSFCQDVGGTEFQCSYTYLDQGAVCRAATGACDVAERCTGDGAGCPVDVQKANCPPVCPTTGLPACINETSGKEIMDLRRWVVPCMADLVRKMEVAAAFVELSIGSPTLHMSPLLCWQIKSAWDCCLCRHMG